MLDDKLLTTHDLSARTGMSESHYRSVRTGPNNDDLGPPFIKIGRAVRYRPEDVEAWLERRAAKQRPRATS